VLHVLADDIKADALREAKIAAAFFWVASLINSPPWSEMA
jgi:hypothetical protein